MALVELHLELARTNDLLARIADALDRAIPAPDVDHSEHPLIGIADISHFKPHPETEARYAPPPRSFANPKSGETSEPGEPGGAVHPHQSPNRQSTVASWDHEDPLDTLEELDHEWQNYGGVDA